MTLYFGPCNVPQFHFAKLGLQVTANLQSVVADRSGSSRLSDPSGSLRSPKMVSRGSTRNGPVRGHFKVLAITVFLDIPAFAQNAAPSRLDQAAIVGFSQKAAIAALNFQQGDVVGFARAHDDFTSDGWKDLITRMEGFLDQKGAPTFTSSFVAAHGATVLDEKEGVLHLRIPGTWTQSSNLGRTTYRAAIEVYVLPNRTAGGRTIKIQRLEQITCAGASTACQ
jgi:hypothetical protein